MKAFILFLFVLIFSSGAVGQNVGNSKGNPEPYVDRRYNFSFVPPPGSKLEKEAETKDEIEALYICPLLECPTPGVFYLAETLRVKTSVKEIVRVYQQKDLQNTFVKFLMSGFKPDSNVTILSKNYLAFEGKPALRIDFNFTKDEQSLTGAMIQMYVDEKGLVLTFAFATLDSQSDKWNQISETAVRSFKVLPDKNLITVKPPREGIATRIGVSNNDNQLIPPSSPEPMKPFIPKKISGGVLNGKATNLPKPPYPAAAKVERASGAVNVQVTIDHDGKVIAATAVSGHLLLRRAAEEAAMKATFNPTLLSGQPVFVTGVIVYNFVP